jgi:hypothetical protein
MKIGKGDLQLHEGSKLLGFIDPLLGNNCEIHNCTTIKKLLLSKGSTKKHVPIALNCDRRTVISIWSILRCYKQMLQLVSQLVSEWVSELHELLGLNHCELLLLWAGSWGQGTVWETRGRGTSTVGSRYQAAAVKTWLWTVVRVYNIEK